MNAPTITLGMRLSVARKSAGIGADDLAQRLGITPRTVSRYENDKTPVPMAILYAYQDICAVPIEWLRGEVALMQDTVSRRCTGECPCQGTLFEAAA
jgi:transcriptional regulator with XRE-family HTH domain